MLQNFYAVNGQSLIDVCLNTYGTTDLLYKLLQDNAVPNLQHSPLTGQAFAFDDNLVADQGVNLYFSLSKTRYATDINHTNYATQGDFNSDFNTDFSV